MWIYIRDINQIKKQSKVITPTKWLALQFISSCFFIEEINTIHTGVEIFDNIWAWDRYFGVLPFYSTCNCWYFTSFLKRCTKHCRSTILKLFNSKHVIGILRIDVTSFYILSFSITAIFIRSLETVPRQYTPLSKSFSNNVGKL